MACSLLLAFLAVEVSGSEAQACGWDGDLGGAVGR